MIRLLSIVFFFSGFSALLYQVVWQRALTLYYGVGAYSVTLIVSVYMLGLGMGAWYGGRLADKFEKRILIYFLVELGIGIFGLLSLIILERIAQITAGAGFWLSFLSMFAFLCIPTFLMGITLPLLTKIFNGIIGDFLKSVSHLYFVNTLGASLGALFSAYLAISIWGLSTCLYIAVGVNVFLAMMIFYASRIGEVQHAGPTVECTLPIAREFLGRGAYIFVLISGFLAIGYELIWFRMVGVLTQSSPYTFASVLSVYLLGIAIGSKAMHAYLLRHPDLNKRIFFFRLQFLVGVSVAVIVCAYYYLTVLTPVRALTLASASTFPHPSINIFRSIPAAESLGQSMLYLFVGLDVLLWPMIFVFLPTLFMGASFPLISYLSLRRSDKEGEAVGSVYFFNVMGNLLGGILTGLVLLPSLGTGLTLLGFVAVGITFGLLASRRDRPILARLVPLLGIFVAVVLLFPIGKGQLYKAMHPRPGQGYEAFFEEGRDGTILTFQKDRRIFNYINGQVHGVRPAYAFVNEGLESVRHAAGADNVLVIGYGAGTLVETVLKFDEVKKVTLVEINDALFRNLRKIEEFRDLLSDPRLEIVIDDGRRYLLSHDEKFDIILMDPLHHTVAYSNNLYSKEFFELVSRSMRPAGIFMVYVSEKQVLLNTLVSVFPRLRFYMFSDGSRGFCLASSADFQDRPLRYQAGLSRFTAEERENIVAGRKDFLVFDLTDELFDPAVPTNRDYQPVNEYYLGKLFRP